MSTVQQMVDGVWVDLPDPPKDALDSLGRNPNAPWVEIVRKAYEWDGVTPINQFKFIDTDMYRWAPN